MQNVSRRGFLRSLVSAPAAVVAAVTFPAAVAASPRAYSIGLEEYGPEEHITLPGGQTMIIGNAGRPPRPKD